MVVDRLSEQAKGVPLLLDQIFRIEREISAKRSPQKKQRILGLVVSKLGSSLLLVAKPR